MTVWKRFVFCVHCNRQVEVEDGHSCWICPNCSGYIDTGEKDV